MPPPLLNPSTQTALTFEYRDGEWPSSLKFPALRVLRYDAGYAGSESELVVSDDAFPCLEELTARHCALHVDSQRLSKLRYFPRKHAAEDTIRSLHAPNLQVLHFQTSYRNETTREVWTDLLNTVGALRIRILSFEDGSGFPPSANTPPATLERAVQLQSLRMLRFSGVLRRHVKLSFQRDLTVLSWHLHSHNIRATLDFGRCRKLTWVHLSGLGAVRSSDSAACISSLTHLTSRSLAYFKLRVERSPHTQGPVLESVTPGVLQVLRVASASAEAVVAFLRRASAAPHCRLQWLEVGASADRGTSARVFRRPADVLQSRARAWFVALLEELGPLVGEGGMPSLAGLSVGNFVWLRGCPVAPPTGGRHGAGCFGSVGYFEHAESEAAEAFKREGVRRFGSVMQGFVQSVSVLVGERAKDVAAHLRDGCSYSDPVPGFEWALAGWRGRR